MKFTEHPFLGVNHRDCLADGGNPRLCVACGMSASNPIHMEMITDGCGNVIGYARKEEVGCSRTG